MSVAKGPLHVQDAASGPARASAKSPNSVTAGLGETTYANAPDDERGR
jgi:hypothetical protein